MHILAERLGKTLQEIEAMDADEITRWLAFDAVHERRLEKMRRKK